MCPSQSRLALLLGLMFLAGLAGCGQASSNNVSSLESHGSVSESPPSKQGPSPGNHPVTPVTQAASPVPLASGDGIGSASGKGSVQGVDSPHAVPIPSPKPAEDHPVDALVVPAWMAKELASPDVATRLHALDVWAQSSPPGEVDPLIVASEDKDERVRARATELIEQDSARSADAEQSNEEMDDTSGEAEDTNETTEAAGDTATFGEQSTIDPLKK